MPRIRDPDALGQFVHFSHANAFPMRLRLTALRGPCALPGPKALACLMGVMILAACDGRRAVRESPFPDSQKNAALESFRPTEALDHIGEWYPHDWRLHL